MPAPTVMIVANPYEAERMRRAVEAGGFRVAVAEGEEASAVLAEYERESPSVMVLATNLVSPQWGDVLAGVRAGGPRVPVLLIDDGGAPAAARGVDRILRRPIDPASLMATLRDLADDDEPEIEVVQENADDTIIDVPAVKPPPLGMLRADDALDFARTIPDAGAPPPRRLERELAAAEQRLFPGSPPSRPSLGDADVDLDTLGVDTLPGIEAELGLLPRDAALAMGGAPLAVPTPLARPGPLPPRAAPLDAPPPPDAQAAVDDSGDLGETGLPELLARLYRAGFTGRLLLRRGDGERAIFFEAGHPVWATSNLPHDHFADLLWREGRLSRVEHARAVGMPPAEARRLAADLVQRGALPRGELFPALHRHVEELLYGSFAWDRGTWQLSRHAPDERLRIDAHPYALALEGIRRKYGLERLTEKVGPPSTVIASTPALERVAALAGLSDPERAAVGRLADRALTVEELRERAGLGEAAAYALAHALLAFGAAARVAAAEQSPFRPPVDRERALAKHAQVSDCDYFEILGVPREATPFEIRRAWERLRMEFSPDRVAAPVREQFADRLAEIAEVIDEAYRVLADDAVREAYRAHLPQNGARRS